MEKKVRIADVENDDQLMVLEEIAYRIWHEHYEPIIGKSQVDYMLSNFQSAEAIKKQIAEGYKYFLMRFNDEDAGYFAVLPGYDTKEKMFLSKLYVDKKFRGNGIAKSSISYVEQMCKQNGQSIIWLTVNKHNSGSIEAYKKMGFVCTESIVQDIGNGFYMDDYKMEKKINM